MLIESIFFCMDHIASCHPGESATTDRVKALLDFTGSFTAFAAQDDTFLSTAYRLLVTFFPYEWGNASHTGYQNEPYDGFIKHLTVVSITVKKFVNQ